MEEEEKEGVEAEKEEVALTRWNVPEEAEGPLVGWSDAMRQNVPPLFLVYVTHRLRKRLQDKGGLPPKWKKLLRGGVQREVFRWSSNKMCHFCFLLK